MRDYWEDIERLRKSRDGFKEELGRLQKMHEQRVQYYEDSLRLVKEERDYAQREAQRFADIVSQQGQRIWAMEERQRVLNPVATIDIPDDEEPTPLQALEEFAHCNAEAIEGIRDVLHRLIVWEQRFQGDRSMTWESYEEGLRRLAREVEV